MKSAILLCLAACLLIAFADAHGRPDGYKYQYKPTGDWFMVVNHKLNWVEAHNYCVRNKGVLAMPKNSMLNSYLTHQLRKQMGYPAMWIGANDRGQEGAWVYEDGSAVPKRGQGYSSWSHGEPNDGGRKEDCAHFWGQKSGHQVILWNDRPCGDKLEFICQLKRCPAGYAESQGECFKVYHKQLPYIQAQQMCQKYHGNLAMPKNKGLNDFLSGLKNGVDPKGFFWIGLNDLKQEGRFMWADGKPLTSFRKWASGKRGGRKENCVHFLGGSNNSWNDRPCGNKLKFICQLKKSG